MRKLFGLVVVGALVWSSGASAVVKEASISVTNAGAPVAGATISLKPVARTAPQPATTRLRTTTPRVRPPRVVGRRDNPRTYTIRYDDEAHRGMLFDVTVAVPSGPPRTLRGLSLDQILSGIDIAVPGGMPPATAFPPGSPGIPGSPSISFFGVCNHGTFGITETDTISGDPTFRSTPSGNGCGGGVAVTLDSLYSSGALALSPFVSGAYLGQDIRHSFAGGGFIGEEIKFVGTLGLQLALVSSANFQLYLLGGLAVVNKEFTIDFGGPIASTSDQWLWGGTIGGGLAWLPPGLRLGDRQVKLFVQYQHVFVEDAEVRNPAVSPLFAYTFSNDMDIVTLGLSVPFGAASR